MQGVERLSGNTLGCAAAAACLCLLIVGCGSVGEPLPPLLNIPGKVVDLRVTQNADQAELRWTWPRLTTEGSTLRDLEKFEVVALDIPADAGPPPLGAFEELGRSLAVVEGDALPEAGAGGEVVVEVNLADRLDKRTAFAVRGVSSRGKTGPWSDYVIREILRPADSPAQPAAVAVAEGVRVSWPAVDRALRYVVERKADEDFQIVGTTDRSELVDVSAPWEQPLTYRVSSQVGEGLSAVESHPSPTVEITAVDTFPPAPPRLLRAVSTGQTVELTWSASPEPDVAGYIVERNGEPIHEGLLESPAFSDASPLGEGQSEYRVHAVDAKGNRSAPSEPVTVLN